MRTSPQSDERGSGTSSGPRDLPVRIGLRITLMGMLGLGLGCGANDPGSLGVWTSGEESEAGLPSESASNENSDDEGGGDSGASDGAGDEGASTDGCNKIDFLFSIDNSGSMEFAQDALREAFPDFAQSILENVGVEDHHVMVIDSDDHRVVDEGCDQFSAEQEHIELVSAVEKTACDERFGAGNLIYVENEDANTFVGTLEVEETRCELDADRRYLTSLDTNFLTDFECVAHVGTVGSFRERPISALTAALRDEKDDCNAGFLRSDAILVVVVVTNDFPDSGCEGDAEKDPGEASKWVESLYEAKAGQKNAVTAIFFDDRGYGPIESFDAFVDGMGKNIIRSPVGLEDFSAVFEEAVVKIQESCEQFEPVG